MAYDEVYSLQSEEISSAKLKSGSKTSCEPGGICPVNNSLQTFISHSLTIPNVSVWESVVSRGEDVEIMTRICPVQLCLQSSASATYEQLPKLNHNWILLNNYKILSILGPGYLVFKREEGNCLKIETRQRQQVTRIMWQFPLSYCPNVLQSHWG